MILLLIGSSTRGVLGWFPIGTRAFQPSELCKVTLIVMLSKFAADVVERDGALKSFKDIAMLALYFGIPFVLVVKQPDMGTAVVLLAIFVCILFIRKMAGSISLERYWPARPYCL